MLEKFPLLGRWMFSNLGSTDFSMDVIFLFEVNKRKNRKKIPWSFCVYSLVFLFSARRQLLIYALYSHFSFLYELHFYEYFVQHFRRKWSWEIWLTAEYHYEEGTLNTIAVTTRNWISPIVSRRSCFNHIWSPCS